MLPSRPPSHSPRALFRKKPTGYQLERPVAAMLKEARLSVTNRLSGFRRQRVEDDLELFHLHAPAEASSRMRTRWRASRPAASAIWWRQLVPLAASSVSAGAARIFGNTPSSPIFSDIS